MSDQLVLALGALSGKVVLALGREQAITTALDALIEDVWSRSERKIDA